MTEGRTGRVEQPPEGAQQEWLGAMQSLAEQIQKQQQAQQQQQSFQQMTQEVLGSYSRLFDIPLSYAQEGLRDARFPIEGYDELTVDESPGAWGRSPPKTLGRFAITRSAPRTARRSWSSSTAG
jgi:hypothetical protein